MKRIRTSLGLAFVAVLALVDKTYDGASWTAAVDMYGYTVAATVQVTALCAPSGQAVAASVIKARDAKIAADIGKRRRAE
jgi:hypothetical protein